MLHRTVQHEGFHQYMNRVSDHTPPIWFNEGMAEYFETATIRRGRMTPGDPVTGNLVTLARRDLEWVPLAELVVMPPRDFQQGDVGLHYAESWAVVHYLLHSDRKSRQVLLSYFDALLAGASAAEAAEHLFSDVDAAELLKRVQAHIAELQKDR